MVISYKGMNYQNDQQNVSDVDSTVPGEIYV